MSEIQNLLDSTNMLIIFGVIGYLIMIFVVVIDYRYNLGNSLKIWLNLVGLCVLDLFHSRTKTHPWKKVAESTHLRFVPGKTYDLAEVTGGDRGKTITLKVKQKILCIKYTSISVNNLVFSDQTLGTEENIIEILGLMNTSFPLKGLLKIEQYGQNISYEQFGVEYDKKYLQFIITFLSDIAELYPKVVPMGGIAIKMLQQSSVDNNNQLALQILPQLLQDIAINTKTNLEAKMVNLLCVDCFSFCSVHEIETQWDDMLIYYGCRICHQSRTYLEVTDGIVAVLDKEMDDLYIENDDGLCINWFKFRRPFDFDSVVIKQASDEDVERFAIQIGNDTDIIRRSQYSQIDCLVSSDCNLSLNTMRILQYLFKTASLARF
ncbi:MAG: hypothetical protein GY797_28875 [Deltaproteobacteria bacterium]|nr:hypothetical protein [Deltaproteobacteria bacterium]